MSTVPPLPEQVFVLGISQSVSFEQFWVHKLDECKTTVAEEPVLDKTLLYHGDPIAIADRELSFYYRETLPICMLPFVQSHDRLPNRWMMASLQ